MDLKKRATTKEIKREPAQKAAVDLLSNKSCATANVSLLAHLQKLSPATLRLCLKHRHPQIVDACSFITEAVDTTGIYLL